MAKPTFASYGTTVPVDTYQGVRVFVPRDEPFVYLEAPVHVCKGVQALTAGEARKVRKALKQAIRTAEENARA